MQSVRIPRKEYMYNTMEIAIKFRVRVTLKEKPKKVCVEEIHRGRLPILNVFSSILF